MPTFTLEVKTLGGCVLTLEVIPANAMLLNKKEDSNEDCKYLNLEVQLLAENTLLSDDDQTLESLGLHGESDVMVVYSRRKLCCVRTMKCRSAPSNWRGWPGPVPKGHDEGLHEIHRGEDAARSSRERRDGGGTRAAALNPYINLRCILLHVMR